MRSGNDPEVPVVSASRAFGYHVGHATDGWVAQWQSKRLIIVRSAVRICPQPPTRHHRPSEARHGELLEGLRASATFASVAWHTRTMTALRTIFSAVADSMTPDGTMVRMRTRTTLDMVVTLATTILAVVLIVGFQVLGRWTRRSTSSD